MRSLIHNWAGGEGGGSWLGVRGKKGEKSQRRDGGVRDFNSTGRDERTNILLHTQHQGKNVAAFTLRGSYGKGA